ncbi:hypothetical protein HYQ46_009377 [Verticillium longisporum]|nr:hypothetical protein HYQ46_009377 [Verticillium longisporum]
MIAPGDRDHLNTHDSQLAPRATSIASNFRNPIFAAGEFTMANRDQEPVSSSWIQMLMDSTMMSSTYPTMVRYISGACIALGLFFILPAVILVLLDLVIWFCRLLCGRAPALTENAARHESGATVPEASPHNRRQDKHVALQQVLDGNKRRVPQQREQVSGSTERSS